MRAVQLGDVVLGEGRAKVIVPLTGATTAELVEQAASLAPYEVDVVEWRVDFLDVAPWVDAVLAAGRRLVEVLGGRPLLFTFRTPAEGGAQPIETDALVALYLAVIESGLVDAVDVEWSLDAAAAERVVTAAHAHGVVVVGSSHEFRSTPSTDAMVARLVALQERGSDIAKLAVMPLDAGDVLRLLQATWIMTSRHDATPVLTMAMAGLGVVTRLAAQTFGSCATFAAVGRASAPGQVPLAELRPILRLIDAHLQRPAP
nr:type I 3-dehydroquinate dehydratase [Propionibacterium sp.]